MGFPEKKSKKKLHVFTPNVNGDSIFILQSLTTSKMRKSQTLKLSQLHKAKLAGLKAC
jgi:hypothetical protein